MGQQQLLLIILATIIVGIAVAGGVVLFRTQAVNAARDAVALDLEDLAARAHAYYRKPRNMGGGQSSFTDANGVVITIAALTNQGLNVGPPVTSVNANGRYSVNEVRSGPDTLVLVGRGFEVVGDDTVEVEAIVTSRDLRTFVIH